MAEYEVEVGDWFNVRMLSRITGQTLACNMAGTLYGEPFELVREPESRAGRILGPFKCEGWCEVEYVYRYAHAPVKVSHPAVMTTDEDGNARVFSMREWYVFKRVSLVAFVEELSEKYGFGDELPEGAEKSAGLWSLMTWKH